MAKADVTITISSHGKKHDFPGKLRQYFKDGEKRYVYTCSTYFNCLDNCFFFLIIYIHIGIFVVSVLVSLNRFNPPVVHARSGQRMTMHVANQVLASMRYNHPKPQVNVFVLGTVYILGH